MDFLENNERLVTNILKSNASSGVLDILSEQMQMDIREHMKTEADPLIAQSSAMFATIYAGAIVTCGKWWILQKNRPDQEHVVKAFNEFIMRM